MSGFRAEPRTIEGEKRWVILDLDTKQVVATGDTVSEAVRCYEESEEQV